MASFTIRLSGSEYAAVRAAAGEESLSVWARRVLFAHLGIPEEQAERFVGNPAWHDPEKQKAATITRWHPVAKLVRPTKSRRRKRA